MIALLSYFTPAGRLHRAIAADDVTQVDRALRQGARIDLPDRSGDLPLHVAIRTRRSMAVVTRLVEAGADVMASGRGGETAVEIALRHESFTLTHALTGLVNQQARQPSL